MFLTKNDFILGRSCDAKLYYKKLRYPSLNDDDPYLEFLRDGGYMVETIAKLLYPDGKELGGWNDPGKAFEELTRLLSLGDGTFFEATVINANLLARVDILQRTSTVLRVIEVKSSSFDSRDGPNPFRGSKGGILATWRDHLEDLTYQVVVLRRAFPEFTVVPALCLVDKSKTATSHTTFDKFKIYKQNNTYAKPRVEYLGDRNLLMQSHQLSFVDAAAEVEELASEVSSAADRFSETLQSDPIVRITPTIGKMCKACEYRISTEAASQNGFKDCWQDLANCDPHVLDLYRVDSLRGRNQDLVAEMAREGKAQLFDINDSDLRGAYAERQRLQIKYTKDNAEYISEALVEILASHTYPLHFIDFEISRAAIPYRSGMRAYELAAFQWSCETIPSSKEHLIHKEWLNSEDPFPNFAFARSLRSQIGDKGTIYIWSSFEISVLSEIRTQMGDYGEIDNNLAAWLDEITAEDNPRIVDLCALAKEHYFHPDMKSSLSIKNVLAAAWRTNEQLRENLYFKRYARSNSGKTVTPYESLPPFPIAQKEEVVNEGTGAMRVYQDMMFGFGKNDQAIRESYRRLLLQYCELDTKAMVFIWMHWQQRTS